jgi:phospholipase/carboxylesterase
MAELPLEHVSITPETPPDGPATGLFILHGRGADERDLLPVADRLPDRYHVISLQAPDRMGPGFTWYDLDLSAGHLHDSQPDPEGFTRSLELIAETIPAAIEAFGLRDRVAFLGFSQGAITATATLLDRPDRVAWLAALHGYLPEAHADRTPDGLSGTPVFVGRGESDEIIPPERGDELAERLSELGCAVTGDRYPGGHGIGREELAELVAFVEAREG